MILGIGIDMVEIARIERILESDERAMPFISRVFTKAEREAAPEKLFARAEYFAARFAAKEAVFKALSQHTKDKRFDPRLVETLNRSDGSPYVNITVPLRSVLKETGTATIHISITTEGGFAAAFVVAES